MTFGEQFAQAVGEYLKEHRMLTAAGAPTLGKMNGKILGELADRFKDKWDAAQKPKKAKRTRTIDPSEPARQIPPTIEMVQEHVREKGFTFTAEKFWHFYNSKEWDVGDHKMKNWHSACVTFQGDTPRRAISPSATAKPAKKAMSEPAGWRAIALQTEGLEWAGNGPTWESLLEFYQQRLANLCRNRDAAERQQEITDRIAP